MKKLRFSINLKIYLGILAILGSVMLVGYNVFNAAYQESMLYEQSLSIDESTHYAEEMRDCSNNLTNSTYLYNLTGVESHRQDYASSLGKMTTCLDELAALNKGSDKEVFIEKMRELKNGFPAELDVLSKVKNDEDSSEKNSVVSTILVGNDVIDHTDAIDIFLDEVEEANEQELALITADIEKKKADLKWWVIFGTALCSSMALLTALILVFSVTKPLVQLTKVIDDISKGDLSAVINKKTLNTNDEIGDLARAFDRTMVSLKLAMKKSQEKSLD